MLRQRWQRQQQLRCQLHNDSDKSGDNDDNDDGDGDSGDDGDNDHKGDGDNDDDGDSGNDNDNNNVDNDDDIGGGSRRATAVAGGMVWGRRQVAEAAKMRIKRKWEQCGYNRWTFLYRKIVTWDAFYMYPTACD